MLFLLVACPKPVDPPPTVPPAALSADAIRGVADPALQQLLSDHWTWYQRTFPEEGTRLGEHAHDSELTDVSEAAGERYRQVRDELLHRARQIDPASLSPEDRDHHALFVNLLEDDLALDVCRLREWQLSPRLNAFQDLSSVAEFHRVSTPSDGATLMLRYRAFETYLKDHEENLRRGAKNGWVASAESVQRTIDMLDGQLGTPLFEWGLMAPVKEEHPDWGERQLVDFRGGLREAVETVVQPALKGYRDFLAAEILPKGRPADAEGAWALPEGEACYEALVRSYTTLPLDAKTVHQTGLDELVRIHAEMADLGERVLGTRELPQIFARLREDPALRFTTEDEVEAKAAEALARAKAAIPSTFGRLPKADCVVERIPAYEAPYTTIAYYQQASPDGSRPGTYFINTYEPATRPRFEAEALAWHESIPGHHLQIAIAQELTDVPAFRRNLGVTALVEGWALYSEQLADEMGLYSSDLDRLGMLSFDSWRAARLVVDTGVHEKRWTREQAIAFMMANTPLAENNIENEVDRYVTWPGQALAYKTGQLEVWKLRREAEAELGTNFSLPAFHDVVLGGGNVTLPVLRQRVARWIDEGGYAPFPARGPDGPEPAQR